MALSLKQAKFVKEYLVDLNATQAAVRAGYSKRSAHVDGPRMLSNASVKAAVAEASAKVSSKLDISAEYVLGGLKSVADQPESESGRLKALELLGKYLKLFTEKVEHDHKLRIFVVDPYAEPKK